MFVRIDTWIGLQREKERRRQIMEAQFDLTEKFRSEPTTASDRNDSSRSSRHGCIPAGTQLSIDTQTYDFDHDDMTLGI